jgi:hypothetical protein
MSISGKALKRLQAVIPDLRLCKNMLVIPPTEHIIRGFMFEYTPYKGLFYFWSNVLPLYTEWPVMTLRYSKRLARSDYIDLGEAEFDRSITRLVDIVSGGELEDLRSIRGPGEFLSRFGGTSVDQSYTPGISPFHAAMTYYLVGNVPFCLNILEDYAGEDLRRGRADDLLAARDLLHEMRVDPSAAGRRIAALESQNIANFGLAPSISVGV